MLVDLCQTQKHSVDEKFFFTAVEMSRNGKWPTSSCSVVN